MVGQEGMVWSTATHERRAALQRRWQPTAEEMGRRLTERRRLTGWNQYELAAALGVRQSAVSLWERGGLRTPQAAARRMAQALEVLERAQAAWPAEWAWASSAPSTETPPTGDGRGDTRRTPAASLVVADAAG